MSRRSKKVEVDVDRDDINKQDMKRPRRKRGQGKEERVGDSGNGNDPSWYAHNPQLLRDSASFPFSYPLGTRVDWNRPTFNGFTVTDDLDTVWGLAILDFMPTVGPASGSFADPVNIAAATNYTFVRHAVSTYANYDATDLMMYLIAMDSAYAAYAAAVRIYGLMQPSYIYDRYYPKSIVESLGWDYDSIAMNLADFRAEINAYAFKLAQFCVPNTMDYYKRHVWMNTNVFHDSETVKAQTYAFNQTYFYQFVEVTEGPGYLNCQSIEKYKTSANKLIDLNGLSALFSDIINPLLASQDIIAMSGDILRAYGQDNLFAISPIAENYFTVPTMSREVLSQFENATVVGDPVRATFSNLTVSPDIIQLQDFSGGGPALFQGLGFTGGYGSLDYKGTVSRVGSYICGNRMLNMHMNDVTPDDVMVATRLTVIGKTVTSATDTDEKEHTFFTAPTVGSEVCTSIHYHRFNDNGLGSLVPNQLKLDGSVRITNDGGFIAVASSAWSAFDWCPWLAFVTQAGNNYEGKLLMDIDNYTLLDYKDMVMLTQCAMLSLFDNPAMGSLAKQPTK